jgi:hypothetical protein
MLGQAFEFPAIHHDFGLASAFGRGMRAPTDPIKRRSIATKSGNSGASTGRSA